MSRLLLWLSIGVSASAPADEPPFPNASFEMGTLDGWTATGEAFATQPTRGDNPAARGRESAAADGDWWVGTYENFSGRGGEPGRTQGDGKTGTLTSPPFTVTQPYLKFRVGGGNQPDDLGVRLLVGARRTLLSSGFDSETMVEVTADVSAFVGQTARLEIFDQATGRWGHINVDAFAATDRPLPPPTAFRFTRDISDSPYPDAGYDEPLRPQFHFTSKRGWINDPNGMVYDGRQYHLFFQHNPLDTVWGNMTWGHAVSEDMVRWTQKPHALLPYRVDRRDGTIFSGTAVVDHNDSLGLRQPGTPKTLAAFYTFANTGPFYQAMATSTDGGKTFRYHDEGRAVVDNQGFDNGERDPKVFWHEPSSRWVMALWVERENEKKGTTGRVRFFTSENLTDWKFASDLIRPWAYECMDVIFLPVDGDRSRMKAVVYDASFDYEIGTFDGTTFTAETPTLEAGRGNFYAAQTFNDMPAYDDGTPRAVQIGWMRGGPNPAEAYGLPYNGQMTVPNDLTLRTTDEGVRLFVYPAAELASLVTDTHAEESVTIEDGEAILDDLDGLDLVDLEITFRPQAAAALHFDLPHAALTWHADGRLTHAAIDEDGRSQQATTLADVGPRDGRVILRLLIDRLSVEAYGFGGESFAAHYVSPDAAPGRVSLRAEGGAVTVETLVLRRLESAWE